MLVPVTGLPSTITVPLLEGVCLEDCAHQLAASCTDQTGEAGNFTPVDLKETSFT